MPPSPPGSDAGSSWNSAAVDALLVASRSLVAVAARSIAGSTDVSLPQFRMLVVLSHASSSLTGLATALDVAPSTALRMVDRLINADMVERHAPPEDRRETLLSLTSTGQHMVDEVTARRRRDLEAIVATIPEADLDRLVHAMRLFAGAADRHLSVSCSTRGR